MPITDSEILDLANNTWPNRRKHRLTDIASDYSRYVVLPRILKKGSAEVTTGNGSGFWFNLLTSGTGTARSTGLYEPDNINVKDVTAVGKVPWRHYDASWALDRRLISMNSGAEQIVDMMEAQRAAAFVSLADKLEKDFFLPARSSSNSTNMFGLPVWAVKSTSQGFNGGDPSGFSGGAAGLPVADYPNWKNYTDQYTAVTAADLVKKMSRALTYTHWRTPVESRLMQDAIQERYAIYVPLSTITDFEDVAAAQNDQLGRDIRSMDGRVILRNIPITPLDVLDDDTNKPVYLIDWNVMKIKFLEGEYLREAPPAQAGNAHNIVESFVDLTMNTACVNRRRLSVIRKSA